MDTLNKGVKKDVLRGIMVENINSNTVEKISKNQIIFSPSFLEWLNRLDCQN